MALKKRLTTLGSLMKRPAAQENEAPVEGDNPEANVVRAIRSFCESAAANSGEEVLYLPTIVESAVATPGAAGAACSQIRKYLSKEYYSRPQVQYNAVMLIRILADNPGQPFTKNMDKHFADTVKHLLRNGQDPSVAQILRESLDALDREKAYDINLTALFAMWRKEKGLMANAAKQFGPRMLAAPPWNGQQQHSSAGGRSSSRTLPPPAELSGRIEEARTSAKLLLQFVQSTPSNELLGNDLVKEFSERCMAAQRSIQGYINCDNPPPDDDTMLTLIETNEQLSLAASKHQRAVLQARKLLGGSPSPASAVNNGNHTPGAPAPTSAYPPPPPPRQEVPQLPPLSMGAQEQTPQSNSHAPVDDQKANPPLPSTLQAGTAPRPQISAVQEDDNPFADHHSAGYGPPAGGQDREQTNGHAPSQGPPNTGYQTTASYLGRQEDSMNNKTMHGATQSVSPDTDLYSATTRPKTPEGPGNRRESDVSPVDRSPVTYRY